MNRKIIMVPLSSDGTMLQYESYKVTSYIENFEWYDELIYTDYGRGRSAVYFIWISLITSKTYYMFVSDMDDVIKNQDITNQTIKGKFTFTKKGRNFGIKISNN